MLNREQQEIVALLQAELLDLAGYANEAFQTDDLAEQQDTLQSLSAALDPIANAVELAGLVGLADAARFLQDNFQHLAIESATVSPELRLRLQSWAQFLLDYLLHCDDNQQAATAIDAMLSFYADSLWPNPLNADSRAALFQRFQQSHFNLQEETLIPRDATPDMVSLAISDDVRPELLDSMLVELPRQTRELEDSISRYLKSREIDELSQARRTAHTLKGAANIVGVPGIANLMHYLEDVLEVVARYPERIDGQFNELLQTASDTFAMMAEYLVGVGPAPGDAQAVLQRVLDYAWRLQTASGQTSGLENKCLEEDLHDQDWLDTDSFDEQALLDELSEEDLASHTTLSQESIEQEFHNPELPNRELLAQESLEGAALSLSQTKQSPVLPNETAPNETRTHATVQQAAIGDDLLSGITFGKKAKRRTTNAKSQSTNMAPRRLQNEPGAESQIAIPDPQIKNIAPHSAVPSAADLTPAKHSVAIPQTLSNAIPAKPSDPVPAKPAIAVAPQTEESEDEQYRLSVSLSVAQELLRVAGESQITNAQIESQLEAMRASVKSAAHYQTRLRAMALELESLVQTQNAVRAATMKYSETDIDPIEMERYSELDTFSNQLLELTTDTYEAIAHLDDQLRDLGSVSYAQRQLNKDNQGILLRLRMVPVDILQSRFARCVRQACRLSGKVADFELVGGSLLVDSMVLNRIADPVMHLLRNAVDHGLEASAELRRTKGKPSEGKIILTFEQRGETLSIRCDDDGDGLDYQRIAEKAVAANLLSPTEADNERVLEQVILLPGFSTRDTASQTSGRGIGLDAVVADTKALKGALSIQSVRGEGSCFSLTVPTSILTGHALLVRCSSNRNEQQMLALVSRNIEQIVYVGRDELTRSGKGFQYQHQDELLDVYNINELVNLYSEYNDQIAALLITRRPSGERLAVGVESVVASQDMVVKALNRYVYHAPGIVGATILGDGRVSPVIDLQELPGISFTKTEWQTWREKQAAAADLGRGLFGEVPSALIVDDSLSARRSLAQFVTDMGMEAITARDGFEAINAINTKKPTLVLVDLEMPRMNGLELTSHLRAREDTKDIPVIMITSRTTDKHRTMAEMAGVNSYLNKPWSEEELLNCIQQQIA